MSTSPVPAAFRSLSFIDRSARRWTRRVPDGSTLADALRAAGFALDFDCGGRGVCGRCAVPVAFLSDASSFQPRLACRTLVDRDDLLVDVSALPTLEEKRAERLASPLPETTLQPTAEERGGDFGFAVDLGTTTLVCALVSLASGRSLVVSTRRNPQIAWGRDVLSRLGAAVGSPAVAAALRSAVVRELGARAAESAAQIGVSTVKIREIVVAGNATESFLFCGRDVSPLGAAPFFIADRTFPEFAASTFADWGVDFAPTARVRVFPTFSAFVGGDVLAGFERLRTFDSFGAPGRTALFLDVGTNGEAILARDGRFFATSTAAGPAFEGAEITCGSLAVPGAIRAVDFSADGSRWRPRTVGDRFPPQSVCGSGLVDALAGALTTNAVAPNGRLRTADAPEIAELPADFRRRLADVDGERTFEIAQAAQIAANLDVNAPQTAPFAEIPQFPQNAVDFSAGRLTQRDVRRLQLAIGAIRAGLRLLCEAAETSVAELDAVYLAGGFGGALNRTNARRVGLLPPEIPNARIVDCGNSSLFGAVDVLTKRLSWAKVTETLDRVATLDLATDPRFAETFAESTRFPTSAEFRE
ncbi:MAG: DUF4445 domain-containing protein [Thermoguttaceae bacterium]|nr:DUF4445 domain-containing protein [Thermoguttaceae bacterium]